MRKAICVVALATLAASSGCTPRMAAAAAVGVFIGAAVAAAADEHHAHYDECPSYAYCRPRTVIVYHHADPYDYEPDYSGW